MDIAKKSVKTEKYMVKGHMITEVPPSSLLILW